MTRVIIIIVCICLGALGCNLKDGSTALEISEIKKYIHIAHTRTESNPNVVDGVKGVDYSKFDMRLLGGDMAWNTSIGDVTMAHIDSIFDLENEKTLWSLGNHDYNNLDRITQYTHRPAYYSYHYNGITFMVLDTQDSLSNITGAQAKWFNDVTDTLKNSSHLVILHHKLIWMYGNVELEPRIKEVSNGKFGDCFYCINENNFYPDIYPKLVSLKQRGIDVICIAGDIGKKVNEFEYKTPEGIMLLASGMSKKGLEKKALLLYHNLGEKSLSWKFRTLNEL